MILNGPGSQLNGPGSTLGGTVIRDAMVVNPSKDKNRLPTFVFNMVGPAGESLRRHWREDSDMLHQEGAQAPTETKGMPTQDQYIDARLGGIESKLDARMDAMQRFQEQAEARFQRANERHDADIALARQQIHQEFKEAREAMTTESVANRRHATTVAWATVAGVFAGFAIVITLAGYWISEQGSYAKSYGETRVELQQAADERSEFREAVQSIQQTQQSILDRLPAPGQASPPQ